MLARRLTIFRLGLLIVVAAIDMAMIRDWYITIVYRISNFLSGFIAFEFAMFNILAMALSRSVFSGAERRNFSRGFFMCGTLPFIATMLYSLTHTREEFFHAVWPMLHYEPYSRRATALLGSGASMLEPLLVLLMMSAVFSIPQIVIAGFGGTANLVAWKVSQRFPTKIV